MTFIISTCSIEISQDASILSRACHVSVAVSFNGRMRLDKPSILSDKASETIYCSESDSHHHNDVNVGDYNDDNQFC